MQKSRFADVWLMYWAKNMSLVKQGGLDWIGFRYTPDEEQQLTTLATQISFKEFVWFAVFNTSLFMGIAALLIVCGMFPILETVYPVAKDTSALFLLSLLGLICVAMLTVGLPLCMGLSGFLVNGLFRKSRTLLPPEQSQRLYRKVIWQFFRMGALVTVISLGLALWDLRTGGRISRILLPISRILGPMVSVATLLLVFGRKKQPA